MKKTIVILGATGDLTRLKLLPAIQMMAKEDTKKTNDVSVIACGRREMTHDDYIRYLAEVNPHPYKYRETDRTEETYSLEYLQISYGNDGSFEKLWERLEEIKSGQLLFFLALGPDGVMATLPMLETDKGKRILGSKNASVILEKPYGEDLGNALDIVNRLNSVFGEKQVLLNDHYLHKKSVRSLLDLKLKDRDFSSAIDPRDLRDVRVVISEQVDLGTRAGYFDCRGMVIDWVQSHILQLLSTILVPKEIVAEGKIVSWKADFLENLSLQPGSIIRGQYEDYKNTEGVDPECETETFFACRLKSKQTLWKGVSFSLISGKAMAEKSVCFRLTFKTPHTIYGNTLELCLEPISDHVDLEEGDGKEYLIAIKRGLDGNSDNFLSDPEMKAQWRITEEIQANIPESELQIYKKGISYMEFCNDKWCSI